MLCLIFLKKSASCQVLALSKRTERLLPSHEAILATSKEMYLERERERERERKREAEDVEAIDTAMAGVMLKQATAAIVAP
jgi:hypothetical protein